MNYFDLAAASIRKQGRWHNFLAEIDARIEGISLYEAKCPSREDAERLALAGGFVRCGKRRVWARAAYPLQISDHDD